VHQPVWDQLTLIVKLNINQHKDMKAIEPFNYQ